MGQDIEKGYNEDYNVRWAAISSDDESHQIERSKWAKGIESTLEIISLMLVLVTLFMIMQAYMATTDCSQPMPSMPSLEPYPFQDYSDVKGHNFDPDFEYLYKR